MSQFELQYADQLAAPFAIYFQGIETIFFQGIETLAWDNWLKLLHLTEKQ